MNYADDEGDDLADLADAFTDHSLRHVRPRIAVHVWMILLCRSWNPDRAATVSDADIAETCNRSIRTVRRAKGALLDLGLIRLVKSGNPPTYRVRPYISDPESGVTRDPRSGVTQSNKWGHR